MDPRAFDGLVRSLAVPKTRRGLLGSLATLAAGLAGDRAADAQVSQLSCGNQFCASNLSGCGSGCVCCVYINPVTGSVTNSRCRPPGVPIVYVRTLDNSPALLNSGNHAGSEPAQ